VGARKSRRIHEILRLFIGDIPGRVSINASNASSRQ
jgi:hypothetical protein